MTFERIIQGVPEWMRPDGHDAAIVISSRARLARNIPGFAYVHRAGETALAEIVDTVIEAAEGAGFDSASFIRNEELDDIHNNVLVERHLVSPNLTAHARNRGVLVRKGETSSVLVNEEDHLRLQVIRSGFDLPGAWESVDALDDRFAKKVPFSFSREYGYLTACPTNVGTGLRVSVLIHLPALVLSREIGRMIRSAGQIGLAVRGYYGEGSEVVGNIFQISNHASLGKTEREIVDDVHAAAGRIIEYEKNAAETLLAEAKSPLTDKVFRSAGILKSARMLSTAEFMNFSSAVRLGVFLNILSKPAIAALNDLMVLVQPGHMQLRQGRAIEPEERDVIRAEMVRERFMDVRV